VPALRPTTIADLESALAEATLEKEYLLSENYFIALDQQCEEFLVVNLGFRAAKSMANRWTELGASGSRPRDGFRAARFAAKG
jgi:hypothetical protein